MTPPGPVDRDRVAGAHRLVLYRRDLARDEPDVSVAPAAGTLNGKVQA